MATLSKSAQDEITSLIDAAVKNPHVIPGTSVAIANKNGEILYQYSAGKVGVSTDEPVTDKSIYWIASCTKIAGTIVALQAVEKGLLSLDSEEDVTKYAPELQNIPILKEVTKDGEFVLVPKKNKITLRKLLTHTAGFGYSFFNHNLKKYAQAFDLVEVAGDSRAINTPLSFEPGTDWEYGVGIDWALNVVARAEGKTLNELLQENVLKPAGIVDTTFRPDADMKSRLMKQHQRAPDGTLTERPPCLQAILADDPVRNSQAFDSAGAGVLSRPSEYVKLLAILLNKGVAQKTGARILSDDSVKEMFTNQIPQWPDFARRPIETAEPLDSNTLPQFYPQPNDPPQGWGLSWFLNTETAPTGRKPYSAFWCGLANLYYWVDPESGVTGMIATQILPFCDLNVLTLFGNIEATVYKGLNQ